jgi:hypothetical protein
MATDLSPDLQLAPISGEPRSLAQWLTTFHLASVVIDPYTNESSWILPTAARVLRELRGASVRVNFLCASDADGARRFLGPLADEFLVFADPDRIGIKALGLERLPAFVFVRQDGAVVAAAEGWSPAEWRAVGDAIAAETSWISPVIPERGDPPPYQGSAALG